MGEVVALLIIGLQSRLRENAYGAVGFLKAHEINDEAR